MPARLLAVPLALALGRGTTGSLTTTFWLNRRNRVYKVDLSRIIGD